jgi:hypothetical protein
MVDIGKREDLLLEHLFEVMGERDTAKDELAAERVAHRLTKKELQDVTELALR